MLRERGIDAPDSGEVGGIYDEHGPALRRYALLLTGDPVRAANVVQETVLRAGRDPEVADSPAPSARAWRFTVARDLIIDERRRARFSNDVEVPGSMWPDRAEPEEVNAAGPVAARRRVGAVAR